MPYVPYVYKSSGGDQLNVDSSGRIKIGSGGEIDILAGGRLEIAGVPFITSGGNVSIGSLTSGNINTTGSVIATSGLTGSSGTFTNGIAASTGTFTGGLALTSGITGTTGNFSSGFAIGGNLAVTSGLNATTGTFTSGVTVGQNLTITSGLNATTGQFSGAVTVGAAFTMSSAMVRPFEQPATGVANPYTITAYGITRVWSSASDSTAGRRFNLGAPVAGVEKWIVCTKSTATAPAIVSSTGSTGLFDNANSVYIFSTGAANVQWIHLLGENSTNWLTLSRSTDITVSST